MNRESVVREDVGASEGEVYTELYPGRASNATAMRHREAWLAVRIAHGGGGGSTVGVFSTPRRRMRLS